MLNYFCLVEEYEFIDLIDIFDLSIHHLRNELYSDEIIDSFRRFKYTYDTAFTTTMLTPIYTIPYIECDFHVAFESNC